MNALTRIIALPLLSAGILGGALGIAGTAAAATPPAPTGHSVISKQDKPEPNNPTTHTWRERHRDNHNHFWRH